MRKNSLESIIIFTTLIAILMPIMPIYSINTDIIQEFSVKIGEERSYSVLDYYFKKNANETERERNTSFTDIFGEKHHYIQRKGTNYTYKIIYVNNSCVIVNIQVDNLLIKQVKLWERMLLSVSMNQSYFEDMFQHGETSRFELNETYLCSKTGIQLGFTISEEYVIWNIATGWLKSFHQIIRTHTEIEFEYLLEEVENIPEDEKNTPWLNLIQFSLLNLAALGIGMFIAFLFEKKKN